jgi:hypothetical protein
MKKRLCASIGPSLLAPVVRSGSLLLASALAVALATEAPAVPTPAQPAGAGPADAHQDCVHERPEARSAATLRASLPPLPEGVADLDFRQFYRRPIGPRGLELTEEIRRFDGRRVRAVGYMVKYSFAEPGTFLLTPFPVQMDDCHYGLADDLPPQTLHVTVPDRAGKRVPHQRGPLVLFGRIEVGQKAQPDGRDFAVRLVLDEAVAAAPAGVRMNLPAARSSSSTDGQLSADTSADNATTQPQP